MIQDTNSCYGINFEERAQTRNKPIVLFVAEAVTLAHFARIVVLAKALDPALYEVVIASDPRYTYLSASLDCTFHSIYSIPSTNFEEALAKGRPVYNVETLIRYVEDDLALFDRVKPDLVVGDFRLSLAVSAPLHNVPYVSVVNAYWSPFADVTYPVPDLPITRILGDRLGQIVFDIIKPIVFALHAKPLNRVRQHFGLPSLDSNLRNIYTWGDYTLYADIPEVVPTRNLPAHHCYLGPIQWSTYTPLPSWWDHLPVDKPIIFLTLGSSGQADLLPQLIIALSQLSVTVIVATAGKISLNAAPPNVYIADYLPMDIAIRRSQLVICNGGSLSTYQALACGVPIIGLCSNMDQLLNMGAVERLGVGILLRAAQFSAARFISVVIDVLDNLSYAQNAGQASRLFEKYDARQRFREFIWEMMRSEM